MKDVGLTREVAPPHWSSSWPSVRVSAQSVSKINSFMILLGQDSKLIQDQPLYEVIAGDKKALLLIPGP